MIFKRSITGFSANQTMSNNEWWNNFKELEEDIESNTAQN